MNLVIGHGIVNEAELKYTPNGLAVCNLTVDAGKTQYITALGLRAEHLSESKGQYLSWWGRISSNLYTRQDGTNVWHMGLRVSEGHYNPPTNASVKQTIGLVSGDHSVEHVTDRDQGKEINTIRWNFTTQKGKEEAYLVQTKYPPVGGQAQGELEYRTFDVDGYHVRTFVINNTQVAGQPNEAAPSSAPLPEQGDTPWE